MRLRPEHLVIATGLLLAGLIGYAVLFKRVPDVPLPTPEPQGLSPESGSDEPGANLPVPPSPPAPVTAPGQVPPPPAPVPPPSTGPAAAPVTGPAPAIELATLDYDMGTVRNDQTSNGSVTIFNRGDADLAISRVTASCPCTDSKVEPPLIPPGGSAPLTIVLDPEHVHGFESTQHVIVWSNDPKNPHVPVRVKAKIDPEFIVEPAAVDLGQVPQGQTVTSRIMLRQASERPVDFLSAKPSGESPGLSVSLAKRPESQWSTPGRPEYIVDVALDTGQAQPGSYKGSCVIETTVQRLRLHACPVTAEIASAAPTAGLAPPPAGVEIPEVL